MNGTGLFPPGALLWACACLTALTNLFFHSFRQNVSSLPRVSALFLHEHANLFAPSLTIMMGQTDVCRDMSVDRLLPIAQDAVQDVMAYDGAQENNVVFFPQGQEWQV